MNAKTKWNTLSAWRKGALIGFVISIILATVHAIASYFNFLQNPASVEVGCVFQKDCMIPFYFDFLVMLVYVIPAMLVGGLIGYFVGKRNK